MSTRPRRAASRTVEPGDDRLSRDRVVDAALALVDREGFGALTMRGLAAELSSSPMALYRHVRDRSDLLDALAEALIREVEIPPSDDWGEFARGTARSVREVALEHPNAFPPLILRPLAGEPAHATAIIGALLQSLVRAGLSEEQALLAARTLASYITGSLLSELIGRIELPGGPLDRRVEFDAGLELVLRGIAATIANDRPRAPG